MMEFEHPEFLWWALPVLLALLTMALLGKRQLPRAAFALALGMRACAVLLVAAAVAGPLAPVIPQGSSQLVLISTALSQAVRSEALAQVGPDARVLDFEAGTIFGASGKRMNAREFLTQELSKEHPPSAIAAWIEAEYASEILALCESFERPLRLYPQFSAPSPSPPDAPSQSPALVLSAPPVVLPFEPFDVRIERWGKSQGQLRLERDGNELTLRMVAADSFVAEGLLLEAGSTHLVATLVKDGQELARVAQSITCSAREQVVVLSPSSHTVDTMAALLPRFEVIGLSPLSNDPPLPIRKARALMLPLSEVPSLPPAFFAEISAYVQDGGCLLCTGLTADDLRKRAPDAPLLEMLPVHFRPSVEKEPSQPDTREEHGEADIAKVSVVFVIDHSESMVLAKRWNHCRAAIAAALERIQHFDRAGVLLFTNTQRWAADQNGIGDISPSTVRAVNDYLANNGPERAEHASNTDIYAAVLAAVQAQESERAAVKLVVLVSDGEERHAPDRIPEIHHLALRKRAMDRGIMIATIRVGADEGNQLDGARAERTMKALATREDLATAVIDVNGKEEIPALALSYVLLAYRTWESMENAKKTEPEPPEEIKPRLSDQPIPGTVEVILTPAGRAALATETLLSLGEGLAQADLLAGASMLAQLKDDATSVAAAARRFGLGSVLYFAAPLNATSAGSFMLAPDASAAVLDAWLRRSGRARLSELSPLLGMRVEPGLVSLRPSHQTTTLNLVAIMPENKAITIPLESSEGVRRASIPFAALQVEVRDARDFVLARADMPAAPAQVLRTSQNAPLPLGDRPENVAHASAPPLRVRDHTVAGLLIAAALCLLAVDRYARRT